MLVAADRQGHQGPERGLPFPDVPGLDHFRDHVAILGARHAVLMLTIASAPTSAVSISRMYSARSAISATQTARATGAVQALHATPTWPARRSRPRRYRDSRSRGLRALPSRRRVQPPTTPSVRRHGALLCRTCARINRHLRCQRIRAWAFANGNQRACIGVLGKGPVGLAVSELAHQQPVRRLLDHRPRQRG